MPWHGRVSHIFPLQTQVDLGVGPQLALDRGQRAGRTSSGGGCCFSRRPGSASFLSHSGRWPCCHRHRQCSPVARHHRRWPESTPAWSGGHPLFQLHPWDFPPLGITPSGSRTRGVLAQAVPSLLSDLCLCSPQRHIAAVLGGEKSAMGQLEVLV